MRKILLSTGIFMLFISLQQTASSQKRLYIANDDHTDFMWSTDSASYVDAFVQMLDRWMFINDSTKLAEPSKPNLHSKWNCDGSFWVSFYEKVKGTNSPGFDSLIRQIRDGQITVPYSPLVTAYGGVPAEGILRGMYYAGDLERKYGLDLSMATAMENQTMPLGINSLWKGSGAKYCWHGVCACDTKMDRAGFESRDHEMYWAKGLDTNRILMKWYRMLDRDQNTRLGGYAEIYGPNTNVSIDDIVNMADTGAFNVTAAFGVGHDNLTTLEDSLVTAARARTIPGVQDVIVSNEVDFFKEFENTYGASLPSVTKTFGNEWDLNCASIAELSGSVKRSLEKLRAAEAMAAIVTTYDQTAMSVLDPLRKEAWESLGLYWEHSFGFGNGGISLDDRYAFQIRLEQDITGYTNALYNLAKTNLGGLITNGTLNPRFFVFNPLSWIRTDYADYEYNGSQNIHVVDVGTGKETPIQFITKNGVGYLRILASSIPSVGYKVYEIQPGPGVAPFGDAGTNTGNTVENDFFRIDYTTEGVLTSIFDKKNSKELVAVTNGRYVNDMGSGNVNNGSRTVDLGKVSITVTTQTTDFPAHTTKITLFKDIERIEIDNQITENFSDSVRTWSYSFNAASPEVWHEETGAVIKAKLSPAGHYSAQNARYDWSTLNHFASVNEPSGFGVSLSNQDCYFMKIGNSTVASLDQNSAQLNVLAGGTIGGLGVLGQGGNQEFNQRFAITTHTEYNAAAEMKKALEHQDFMVCGTVVTPVNFLLPDEYSFMSVDDPETILWSVKPAEESVISGVVTRAWNLGSADATPTLTYPLQLNEAYRTTHVETTISTLPFPPVSKTLPITLGHHEMKTFRTRLLVVALAATQLRLSGKKVAGTNELNWVATKEDGVKNYVIEKSTDGTHFTTLATTAPVNGNYLYTDYLVNTAIRYFYRVKLVTVDGTSKYSNTISINEDKEALSLIVFPNPATENLHASLVLAKRTRCDLMVVNNAGAVIKTVSPPLFERGYNNYTLSVKELPAGAYNLVIIAGDKKFVQPFIKK